MKLSLFAFALNLIAQTIAFAAPLNQVFQYALDCPNQSKLISNDRLRLNQIEEIPARFESDEKELNFHTERVSKYSGLTGDWMVEQVKKSSEVFDQKFNIRFDPIPLGLPATQDGCRVVPIIVVSRSPATGQIFYTVDSDNWYRMAPIDRLISHLKIRHEDADYYLKRLSFTLSDSSTKLKLQPYYKISQEFGLPGISYDGSDFKSCDFHNDDIPSKCIRGYGLRESRQLKSLLYWGSTVNFWPEGRIASAWLYRPEKVPRQVNQQDFVSCNVSGTEKSQVFYNRGGNLSYCENTFLDMTEPTQVEGGRGFDSNSLSTQFVTLNGKNFDQEIFPNLPNYRLVKDLKKECGLKYIPGHLLQLHENGNFKSGLMKSVKSGIIEYLVANEKGKILRTEIFSCDSNKDQAYVPLAFDLLNEENESIEKSVRNEPNLHVAELEVLYAKPGCFSVSKDSKKHVVSYKIGPQCRVYVKMLGVGSWL